VQRSHFPETLDAGVDSEALVGQVGNLRPIGNRPIFVARTACSPTVSAARDVPEGTVCRSCERASPPVRIRKPQEETQLTELYKLHTPFVVAFLAFVVVFVVAHARR
jgi:hypothetical protein